jgi:hypothetical protein
MSSNLIYGVILTQIDRILNLSNYR